MARIFVLSDDPAVHAAAEQGLGAAGHDLKRATHIHQIGPLLADWPADVLLIDSVMAGSEARPLALRAAQSHGARSILLSGGGGRGPARGRDARLPVLAKPVSGRELGATVERLLAAPAPGPGDAAGPGAGLSAEALRRGFVRTRNVVLRRLGEVFDRRGGEYRCNGLSFAVPRALTTPEFRGRLVLGRYERPELTLARRYVRPDATVLELGGCLGVVACFVNRRLDDGRRHVVLEAHPALIPTLEANRDRNGCAFQVRQAIVSAAGEAAFYAREPFIAGSSTVRLGGRRIDVPTTSAAEIEAETGLSFDTLIVDIEGGEQALFAENEALLARARAVIVELHPHIIGDAPCEEIRSRFRAAGLSRRATMGSVEAWTR